MTAVSWNPYELPGWYFALMAVITVVCVLVERWGR